ncbi:MAG: DUF2846 domain-containing protein [Reyranellaceae bacterium]
MWHLWLVAGALLLSACATAPLASVEADKQGKAFQALPQQAALYVYRESIFGAATSVSVELGQQKLGRLTADTWMRLDLDPARYSVRCTTMENSDTATVDLAAGQVRFLEVAMRVGWTWPRCAVVETDASEGRSAVLSGRRAVASAVAPPPAAPTGPLLLIYRDDQSNERRINLIIRYEAPLGRSRVVPFTIENLQQEKACGGTFTADGSRTGRFTLSCGFLEGSGTYQVAPGDRIDQFVARGQNPRGQPIMLVVGNPAGAPARL